MPTNFKSRSLVALLLTLLLTVALVAQQQSPATQVQQTPPPVQQPDTGPEPAAPSQNSQPAAQLEQKITPEQAKELFASVDEILQFVSKDTGLPIKHPVKRKLASRAEVEKYVQDRMKDDEDSRRLERSEVVLKKFALLPRNFDLRTFMIGLLGEQVAGFYNTKDKTVYLLDWVQPESQKPVLAHELTHALQDQNFNLDKWLKGGSGGKNASEQLMEDERAAARQAVSEGQGMVVLIDYMLAPTGRSLRKDPAIADPIMSSMMTSGQTPMFTRAPLFLKELLVFPYQFGLKFERDVLVARGTQGAFADAFRHPPVDTRQIMQPQTYVADRSVSLLSAPDFEKAIAKDYRKYDVSGMGEFDVWLLLKQYANQSIAEAISPKWRGGYYYAAVKPGTPKPQKGTEIVPEDSLALAYASKWADPEAAQQFAAVYAGYIAKRYKNRQEISAVPNPSAAPGPGATATSASAASSQSVPGLGIDVNAETAKTLPGKHIWTTDSGPVTIDTRGDTVLITEGFDDATTSRLADVVFTDARQNSLPEQGSN